MRFLDYLFHGKELKAIGNYFKMLNGYSPTFTSFSGGVYEMDLTRTAVNNFATHCSKLKPEILKNLTILYTQNGEMAKAKEMFVEAKKLLPNDEELKSAEFNLYYNEG